MLPPADITMFDLAPETIADILGDRLPTRVARAYRRFRRGPGAFKVDFAVEGGVPWVNHAARRAGTVHLAGTFGELALAERQIHAGQMPERPFVLIGQQYLADPQRSVGDIHPVWAYAHVPNGYEGDATAAIIDQIERFAPGFRDLVLASSSRTAVEIGAQNANYVGGDIYAGELSMRQFVKRPVVSTAPWRTPLEGVYLCSSATPPGPAVHGMNGWWAAKLALRERFGIS